MNRGAPTGPDRAAAFWAAFLRNRNVDAGTAGDGAIPVAGGYAIFVTGTRFDFALGAGSTRALRDDDLTVVEEFYAAREHPARFELDDDVLARDGALLRDRGYAEEDCTLAILEGPVAAPEPSGAVTVRTTGNRRAWTDLAARAFEEQSPDLADRAVLLRTLQTAAAAAHVLVIASLDGDDVGAAALGVSGDTALLCSAAVLPAFRRRGVHQALVAARLAIAHERGATAAAIKTVADSPVERSAAKLGFARTGLRRRVRRAPAEPATER
ncbi:MAG: GNAT family N-acetyltransferase [Candidatus Eremiobacteraeota bacterium]|nr:GNAT family N-acetyltransferase [Candidatus Eremiobacteraeota bacterium]